MKTIHVTIIFLLCLGINTYSQSIYYDAQNLKGKLALGKLKPDSVAGFIAVLKKYLPDELKTKPDDAILTALSTSASKYYNPFLANVIVDVATRHVASTQSTPEAASVMAAMSPAGLATTVMDGMAKSLVKRTKEELNTAFFDKFEEALEEQKDLQKLFPSTYTILRTAKDEIYSYAVYLPALQEAFKTDLDNFLANAYAWTKTTDGKLVQDIQKDPQLYAALKGAFYLSRELDRGVHPGDVFHSLTALNAVDPQPTADAIDFADLHTNLFPALQTVDLLSQSLRSRQGNRYWIGAAEFDAFRNEAFIYVYFGLLCQQTKLTPVCFKKADGTDVCLDKSLSSLASDINHLRDIITRLQQHLAAIEDLISTLSNTNTRNASGYAALTQRILSAVQQVSASSLAGNAKQIDNTVLASFYIQHLSALWAHIESKSYNSAIFEAYVVLDTTLNEKADPALKAFLKYGTFMATVAAAQTSDEVEAAIEAIVLPPGSASIKRKTEKNIALNAYVGLTAGAEVIDDNARFAGGITAPIGIAISKGAKERKDKHGKAAYFSRSLFISLVDLGAVTMYRFDDRNTAALPELSFSNIFAPGLYYVRGIARSPISYGVGGQLGPQLRKIETTGATIDNRVNYSFKVFLAVDIPLLNFYTKSK